jgi:3-deoxy-D-manno-oct-2-ulosonic acid (Kdo) hydroxylase
MDSVAATSGLESGNILFFPQTPFAIPQEDRRALLNAGQADGNFHKNISYRPLKDRVSGLGKAVPGEEEAVRQALRNYSRNAIALLGEVIASYKDRWQIDYASFRSIEEEGRDLPWKKRNDLLHTDAFPTRPTNGGLILRIFTNINPEKERVWVTSDPFAALAPLYANAAGLSGIAAKPPSSLSRALKRMANAIGLPVIDRSPYDKFMLGFHDFLKANAAYQQGCPKYRFSFPPNSTWMVFTDVVPHSVLSGRFALEQTMIIPRQALMNPEKSPASILETLCGKPLT